MLADALMSLGASKSTGMVSTRKARYIPSPASEELRCSKALLIHQIYRKTSNISRTLGNKIVDNSDVVGATPVGAAPTTSSFWT